MTFTFTYVYIYITFYNIYIYNLLNWKIDILNRIVDPDYDCVELVENLFFLLGYVKLILSFEF